MPHGGPHRSRQPRNLPLLPGSKRADIHIDESEARVTCDAASLQQLALCIPVNNTYLGSVIELMEASQQAQCGAADAGEMWPNCPGIDRNM